MDQKEFDEKYIRLCTGIDRRVKEKWNAEFVDGPDIMKERSASLEKVPGPGELFDISQELIGAVQGSNSPIEDPRRREYLDIVLGGLQTTTRVLIRNDVPYGEKISSYYGIIPRKIPESDLEKAFKQLDESLPGEDDIGSRYKKWEEAQTIPTDKIEKQLKLFIEESRKRTKQYLELPEGELVVVEFVRGKPWSGYNTYQGNGRSKIAFNVDRKMTHSRLIDMAVHESYPGHHAEHSMKEELLGKKKGWIEETILVYNNARNTISEGIGENGINIIFDGGIREALEWYSENVFREKIDIGEYLAIRSALESLYEAKLNAGLMLHCDHESENSVKKYLEHWLGFDPSVVKIIMDFTSHPIFGTFYFNYSHGKRMVEEAYNVALKSGIPKDVLVQRLYTTQLTPQTIYRRLNE